MLADILGKLIPRAQSRELRSGQFLFRQGDRADYIFALEHGQIILTRYLSDGKSVPMHAARAGQTFTEAALFSDIYHCNAVAGAPDGVSVLLAPYSVTLLVFSTHTTSAGGAAGPRPRPKSPDDRRMP